MPLETMASILEKAEYEGYGVPMFDVMNIDVLAGVLEAAEELRSPVILAYFEGFVPYISLELIGPALVKAAERAPVPVAVHLDHGTTFQLAARALGTGFTSVMIDASTEPLEENVRRTRKVVELANVFGATVEAELGRVGGQEFYGHKDPSASFTDPEEAKQFVEDTGVGALAVAIGSVHGIYRESPRLDFPRLAAIRKAAGIPLVLHGGSGISDDDFRRLIREGISKINIFTDLALAALDAVRSGDGEQSGTMYMGKCGEVIQAVKAAAMEKMQIFGCAGKACKSE